MSGHAGSCVARRLHPQRFLGHRVVLCDGKHRIDLVLPSLELRSFCSVVKFQSLNERPLLGHWMLRYRNVLTISVNTFVFRHVSCSPAWAHQVPTEETILLQVAIEWVRRTSPLLELLKHVLGHGCNSLRDSTDLAEQVLVAHCHRRQVTLSRRVTTVSGRRIIVRNFAACWNIVVTPTILLLLMSTSAGTRAI